MNFDCKMSAIHQAVWPTVGPYLVSVIVYFIVFLITMMTLILIYFISQWVISICEKTLGENSLIIKGLVYASDLFIIWHFIVYLIQESGLF